MTTGEARDLGPRYTTAEDRAPMRDELAESVSWSRQVHVLVWVLDVPAQIVEPIEVEADEEVTMVTRQKMTIDWFTPEEKIAC